MKKALRDWRKDKQEGSRRIKSEYKSICIKKKEEEKSRRRKVGESSRAKTQSKVWKL